MYQDIPKPTATFTENKAGSQVVTRPWYLFLSNIFSIFGPSGIVPVEHGGTGLDETEQGALLYGVDGDEYGIVSKTATVSYLDNGGLDNNPAWKAKAALTKSDDTNVTLTLGGSPGSALLTAASITAGWTGTLAAARLNANVVQSVVNDTNITGSITAQALTLGFTGQLGLTRGGTNADLSATGGSGQVLKQTTVGGAITVGTVTGADITGAALTKTDDTNVTLTLGGAPATSLLRAASLTLGWAGQLGLTRGGTNASLTASNGGIIYSDASGFAVLSGTATAGQIVRSGASSAPSWSTATYPNTATSGRVLLATSANVWGDGPAPVADGTYTFTTAVPGDVTSITFTNGIATAIAVL